MANIKRIFFNGVLTYPVSITNAVIDTETNQTLAARLKDMETYVETGTEPISLDDVRKIINGTETSD